MEFSKKLIIFSYTVLFILLVLYFVVEDKSSWATIVCAWIAECGAATAFYLWKSKNENRANTPSVSSRNTQINTGPTLPSTSRRLS